MNNRKNILETQLSLPDEMIGEMQSSQEPHPANVAQGFDETAFWNEIFQSVPPATELPLTHGQVELDSQAPEALQVSEIPEEIIESLPPAEEVLKEPRADSQVGEEDFWALVDEVRKTLEAEGEMIGDDSRESAEPEKSGRGKKRANAKEKEADQSSKKIRREDVVADPKKPGKLITGKGLYTRQRREEIIKDPNDPDKEITRGQLENRKRAEKSKITDPENPKQKINPRTLVERKRRDQVVADPADPGKETTKGKLANKRQAERQSKQDKQRVPHPTKPGETISWGTYRKKYKNKATSVASEETTQVLNPPQQSPIRFFGGTFMQNPSPSNEVITESAQLSENIKKGLT